MAKEKLAFVTESNEIGVCDKKLGSLNLNLIAEKVVLVHDENVTESHTITFTSSRLNVSSKRDRLSWEIASDLAGEKIIFKVNNVFVKVFDIEGQILKVLCLKFVHIHCILETFLATTRHLQVAVFKDHFGGDRFVNYSLQPEFYLSPFILGSWASKQVYDIKVDAINAWTIVSVNQTGLIAPTKPPTTPQNLRVFATQQVSDDSRAQLWKIIFGTEMSIFTLKTVVHCRKLWMGLER